jgi:hypothetical protein
MKFARGDPFADYACLPRSVYKNIGNFLDVLQERGIRHGDLHKHNLLYDGTDVWILDWGEAEETSSPYGFEKRFSWPPICPPHQLHFTETDNLTFCGHCDRTKENHAADTTCLSFMLSSLFR